FKAALPLSANSPQDLVELCLSALVDRRATDGRPVLPLFVEAVRTRHRPGDGLYEDLGRLAEELRAAFESAAPRPPTERLGLLELLRSLDFQDQVELVGRTIQVHRVAAFLIHG